MSVQLQEFNEVLINFNSIVMCMGTSPEAYKSVEYLEARKELKSYFDELSSMEQDTLTNFCNAEVCEVCG